MKKKFAAVVLCLLCLCSVCGGCSIFTKKYSYTPDGESIFVHADGQITAAIVSDFDKDYYDLAELTGLAERQVQEYNEKYYGFPYYSYDQMTKEEKEQYLLPINLDSISESDGKVTIVITYANGDAYTGFNSIDLTQAGGTRVYTSKVTETSVPLAGTFVAAKGGAAQDIEALKTKKDYYMIYVDYATKISFEHEVDYVSSNVTVVTNNTVQTEAGAGSYILFK